MGQNQVKVIKGDTEAPLLDGGGSNGEDSSDRNTINFDSPLHLAAGSGSLEEMEELLNNNHSDSDSSSMTRELGEYDRTPLHCAILSTVCRNLKVIQLLLQRDKEDNNPPSERKPPHLANLPDAFRKTALHYAAESQEPPVISLLLQFGADPNLKCAQGSTPLHILARSNSDSALRCAKIIVNSPSLLSNPSARSETNANGETAVHVAARSMAHKLLKLLVDKGFDCASPGHCGYTPLMMASMAKDGDAEENLECVKILRDAYSWEQVNATENQFGFTALLVAAQRENLKILELLATSPKTDLFVQESQKNTVFHYAVVVRSLASVKILCESEQMKANNKAKFVEEIFHSHQRKTEEEHDINYESVIEIALRRRYTKIAEYLLAAHPNRDQWMSDEELMSLIYSEHPAVLLSRMDDSLKKSTMWKPRNPEIYFRMITGADDPVTRGDQETKYLYKIKKAPEEEQKHILLHPLVQILLEEKWKRIRMLSWIHMFVHLSWTFCYTLMVYEIYAPDCLNTNRGANQTATGGKGGVGGGGEGEGKGNGHMRILSSLGFLRWEEDCRFNQTAVQCTAVIFYALSAILVVKETLLMGMKFWDRKKNLKWEGNVNLEWTRDLQDFINLSLLLGNIVVAVVNSAPAWQLSSASELAPWQTNLAAIGILVAWVREVDNFPKSGIYSTILKTVLWNCLKTLMFYCPLLIGFAMCLRLLTPGKGQHKYLLFSLVKIAAMMTGELEFEDAFYGDDDDDTPGPSLATNDILAQIVFLLLVFVTTIVVLNLLTGLAVKDVGRLLKEADFQRLSLQLDRVHMFESSVFLARKKLMGLFDFWKDLPYRFNATAEWKEKEKTYSFAETTELVIGNYSEELQAAIREALSEQKEKQSSE